METQETTDLMFGLRTLTVFHAVLDDPVIAALVDTLKEAVFANFMLDQVVANHVAAGQPPRQPAPDAHPGFDVFNGGFEDEAPDWDDDDAAMDAEDDYMDASVRLSKAYAHFVALLFESDEDNLGAHVLGAVLDDENAYLLRVGAGRKVSASLKAAVKHDLSVLQKLANLVPADILECLPPYMRDGLVTFETRKVNLARTYRARIGAISRVGYGMYARYHVFRVDEEGRIVAVRHPDPQRLADLVGYEREKKVILDNTRALLAGLPAANMLLTGDAGTGKSSTVKAVANELADEGLRILEVRKEQLRDIPDILDVLTQNPLKFVIFIDDLSFTREDDNFAALKAILEGSVSAKSDNVVIYATSNRRHLVRETFSQRDGDDVHLNDTLQEIVSLSDRFGIRLSFSRPNKDTYLHIVRKLAEQAGISMDGDELDLAAERFATRRGGRSARGARQFVDSLISAGEGGTSHG